MSSSSTFLHIDFDKDFYRGVNSVLSLQAKIFAGKVLEIEPYFFDHRVKEYR